MENSTFDTTNFSNLIHELLQKQRQIETEFEIDLNRSIIEEEETKSFGDEFVPILNNINNVDDAEEAINNAEEAIENAEEAIENAEEPIENAEEPIDNAEYQVVPDTNPIHASGLDLRGSFFWCGKRNSGFKKTKLVEMVNEEDVNVKTRKPRQVAITRSNCKACIRAKVNKEGKIEVVAHVIQHNHELTRSQWHYLHPSERKMTEEKAEAIKTMKSSGLTTMDTYKYMATEAGGEQNIGHSVVDHLNFCSRLRMEQIEARDAQNLVNILNQEQSKDPKFFFRVKFGKDGRISNIFWIDSMMLEDYRIYGDVLVFDTTYRTNRYNLIYSFIWLLETFLKAMENKKPTSIFTDQDQAMANAIEQVLPNTRHRLCIWHLEQNAITRFGALKKDKEFKYAFNQCLKMCVTEQEFEAKWQAMMQKYELTAHSWYQRVYELKEKWCPALSRDFFSAGILSSQRSESTNHAIGFIASKATTLTEFYTIFKKTINRWRSTEKYDEFTCSKSITFTSLPLSGMLKHAAQVFTLSLFRDFEEEFGYSMATTVQMIGRNEECLLYQVALEDKPWSAHQNSTLAFSNKNTRQCCQRESAEAASNVPDVADSNHSNDDVSSASSTSTSVPTILDPQRVVTKGRSNRAKGGLEKSKRKRKPALPPPHSEFGSKTPNLRLF
ncbi:protein FAR1-RELATED SEQUENCE 5-like [Chenopodium quinoa]|uniref:protein FAR1-RELATED SEQUENCE 5-like n=1 Tax=Chenopodium quinoa TaxID=63459 RepID=UPI000B77266A|nr:protein FAR1-RELATED SEQUENCE 5-like [Chenopodium quinoa]